MKHLPFSQENFWTTFAFYSLFTFPHLAYNLKEAKDHVDSNVCMLSDFPWPLILPTGEYNKEQVPKNVASLNSSGAEPLKIYVSGSVQTIAPIIASETEFRINMRFIITWTDDRLRAKNACNLTNTNSVLLSDEVTKLIWLPCPHIVNSKYEEVKRLNRRLISVRLSTSGTVTLVMVVNATVNCAMNFQWYPMDSQICPMDIESFLYDNSFVDYNWLQHKPFQLLPERLLQFDVEHLLEYTKSMSYRKQLGRNFTRLTVNFTFTRIWVSFFLQTFVPCTIIVSVSWFSFWLELDSTSARGFLLATAMLTLVTDFLSLRLSLPPVAYVKAVDFWMLGCIFLIFTAVAEFTLVKVLYEVAQEIIEANSVKSVSTVSLTSKQMSALHDEAHCEKDLTDHLNLVLYPSYKKHRLGGSALLCGRSTATIHLPSRLEWSILCGLIVVPLIWTVSPKSDEDSDKESEKKLLWRQIDHVSRILFPLLYFLLSFGFWAVVVVFGVYCPKEL